MITEDTMTNEDLSAEAVAAEAPLAEPTKRTRKPKAEKVAKEPKAPKPPKEPKAPRSTIADKFIKNLVTAAESGLRAGTGRFMFLEASESAAKVGDILGKEFQVGDKTVKLSASNIQGMYSRGHVALSADGETWERVQTTVVSE